ncbi:MAG: PIN domain-containing protein [Candidatus Binatia bacterium]
MDRVFLDANVLFSAAYRPDAGLGRLWELADVRLLTSTYAVEEARRNLDGPARRNRLEKLLRMVEVVGVPPTFHSLPDAVKLREKDRPILLAAIHGRASHLLTGDVRDFGRYFGKRLAGILVLSPGDYLRTHPKP